MTERNQILHHAIRAVAYRFRKATAGASDHFGDFAISEHTRTPNAIINHMYDLATKTRTMINEGHFNCPPPEQLDFRGEAERFLSALEVLQQVIEQKEIDMETGKRLLQGPVLDMATHVGQIAMLNGLNGNKVIKENYFAADL